MGDAARTIGVLGAGTMGAGIAQLAALSGARTLLHDPFPGAVEKGMERIHRGLERGRYEAEQAQQARERLEVAPELSALAPCDLVIEAAPEQLELKHELFLSLAEVVDPACVLASNTSSIPITSIAAVVPAPERVVGMHFFNPAPVMKLLEVVAGMQSGEAALALARATGEAMERHVIDAKDGPGFLVNRCNRPFLLEALRLVQERIASVEEVDRACRLAGGFRMGPFELSDLVGVDTGLAVAKSFYELSFGEPRWRPSTLHAQVVAAGLHGRKSGRGWYEYPADRAPHRPEDPAPLEPGGGSGVLVIAGDAPIAEQLREAARGAGWDVRFPEEANGTPPFLVVDCGISEEEPAPIAGPQLLLCDVGPLAELDPAGTAVGFHALPPFEQASLVELTRRSDAATQAVERSEHLFRTLGKHVQWVGDAPGLVLGRIVCQLINECAFALGEGIGSAEDVDAGMTLGLNHPRGPLAWADEIGLDHVLSVLEGLHGHYREERYRPAPLLRELALEGRIGRHAGAGFHSYA